MLCKVVVAFSAVEVAEKVTEFEVTERAATEEESPLIKLVVLVLLVVVVVVPVVLVTDSARLDETEVSAVLAME